MNRQLEFSLMRLLDFGNLFRFFNDFTLNQVAVFMLHRFRDPSIDYVKSSILSPYSPDTLDDCLSYLVKNDYSVLSFKNLVRISQEKHDFYKTVCFTIDDGYMDFKNVVFPLFKKYNLPATVFITTDFVEGKLMMWWDQIEYLINNTSQTKVELGWDDKVLNLTLQSEKGKQIAIRTVTNALKVLPLTEIFSQLQGLSKKLNVAIPNKPPKQYSAIDWTDIQEMEKSGIDFQPHTVNHPILSRINPAEQEWQIKMSVNTIKEKIRSEPVVFCYPNGLFDDFTEDTVALLKRANFIGACSAEHDFFSPTKTDLFYIPRFSFPENYYDFVQNVSGYRGLKLAVKEKFAQLRPKQDR